MTMRWPGRSTHGPDSASVCDPAGAAVRSSVPRSARRSSIRSGAALSLVVVPLALTGCAAGQRAQTANEFSVVDGASADVGSMGLRNAGISAPSTVAGYVKGASATLSMTVINNGNNADTLVSVSTPTATQATVTAPSPTAVSSARAATGISVPPNGAVPVGAGTGAGKITLTGLKTPLVPGAIVTVTVNFRVAGPLTLQLPVKLVPNQTGGETVDVSPSSEAGD